MFPYRRGNKKRNRNVAPSRRGRDGGGRGGPSSVHELLPLLQPATKALAQLLAGNTRPSGQLHHARDILSEAERLIDDRQIDRMIPAHREEFLEQVARLKLTVADAESAFGEPQDAPEPARAKPATPALGPERLRELALSLAGAAPSPQQHHRPLPVSATAVEPEIEPPSEPAPRPAAVVPVQDEATANTPRGARLKLKSTIAPSG